MGSIGRMYEECLVLKSLVRKRLIHILCHKPYDFEHFTPQPRGRLVFARTHVLGGSKQIREIAHVRRHAVVAFQISFLISSPPFSCSHILVTAPLALLLHKRVWIRASMRH
jgi:hypothetical protein